MREYRIAAIPGDGIGIEVIAAGLEALQVLAQRDGGFRLNVEHFPWSSAYYQKHGQYIPEGGRSGAWGKFKLPALENRRFSLSLPILLQSPELPQPSPNGAR